MATISVQHSHTLGVEEAIRRTEALMRGFADKLAVDVAWNGSNATFKGSGFSGTARVLPDKIFFDLDLSLILRPMKARIENRVQTILQEKFT